MPITLEPMYATVGTDVPSGGGADDGAWTFEPKFDGMRVLAFADARRVRLVTRNGKDKAAQFPEVVAALRAFARDAGRSLVVDGEIVALADGEPGPFQALQQRMHLKDLARVAEVATSHPAALVLFDLVRDGRDALHDAPWTTRRRALERLFQETGEDRRRGALRLTDTTTDADAMIAKARADGWEGVIAKRTAAPYVPGARSRDWLKLKLQYRAEFVVGGFTEPRNTRPWLGALLLGYYDDAGRLVYAGHMGGGFDRTSLRAMYDRLRRLERRTSPFAEPPRTNERAHWVTPTVVVEVKFAEWTDDGRLRQPIFLGTRDDKEARDVGREARSMQGWTGGSALGARRSARTARPRAADSESALTPSARRRAPSAKRDVVAQLDQIQRDGGDGELVLGRGVRLHVSSLDKVYFPESGITKGDVMRYYARVAPRILPLLKDRPLALKRYPEGIAGHSFYQQNAPKGVPDVVRVEEVAIEGNDEAPRIIGGDLPTLLWLAQMGTIAIHAWLSRLATLDTPDVSIIDLDPDDDVPFAEVVRCARVVGTVADELGLVTAVKTSGAHGIHVGVPLPRGTEYEASARLAQTIAERVMEALPTLATMERRIQKRPKGTIYLDVQQNARGKSVVSAYSVRAMPGATVSAPLQWTELRRDLTLGKFAVPTMPRRLDRVGDLWGDVLRRGNTRRTIAAALRT